MSVTAATAWRALAARLPGADSRLEARLILEAVGADAVARPDDRLSALQRRRCDELAARRVARQPLSHVLGFRGFWTLDVEVTADVLTPRPETEHVVEALLAAPAPETARVLDLGTGSGAILCALLSERPRWTGVGVDASDAALNVARRNAMTAGVADRAEFRLGDWDEGLDERFDLIACNPPYIPTADIAGLEPEVRDHEPRAALDGGVDGLDVYRRLAPRLPHLLAPAGSAAFEVGMGQADTVAGLFAERLPEAAIGIRMDLAGAPRVVTVNQH